VIGLLAACALKYPKIWVMQSKAHHLTRSSAEQLVAVIQSWRRQPEIAARHLPGRRPLIRFLEEVLTVNATWVETKHGEDVEEKVLHARMRTMLKLANIHEVAPSRLTSVRRPSSRQSRNIATPPPNTCRTDMRS
jgi:hypothetical protein